MAGAGTILLNYFSRGICQMFAFLETLLVLRFPNFRLIYIKKKKKMNGAFTRKLFAITNSD